MVVNWVHEPQDLYKLYKDANDKEDMYADFLENSGISIDDCNIWVTMKDYYGGIFTHPIDVTDFLVM